MYRVFRGCLLACWREISLAEVKYPVHVKYHLTTSNITKLRYHIVFVSDLWSSNSLVRGKSIEICYIRRASEAIETLSGLHNKIGDICYW